MIEEEEEEVRVHKHWPADKPAHLLKGLRPTTHVCAVMMRDCVTRRSVKSLLTVKFRASHIFVQGLADFGRRLSKHLQC